MGESTTSAVVISLVAIFIADFVLSFTFYQVRRGGNGWGHEDARMF